MDYSELEGIAEKLNADAGVEPEGAVPILHLIRCSLGKGAVELVSNGRLPEGVQARAIWRDGRPSIEIRQRLSLIELREGLAHELAEHVLERARYLAEDREVAACYLGAAILAPRALVRNAVRLAGLDFEALGRLMLISQAQAVLRVGVAYGIPVSVVSAGRVRVSGPENWAWGTRETLRKWASEGINAAERYALTEPPGAVALLFDPLAA